MSAEDQQLLREIALVDKQLELACLKPEELIQTTQVEDATLNSRNKESLFSTSNIDCLVPKDINSSCQKLLKKIEKSLIAHLEENKEKQDSLLKYLNESNEKCETFEKRVFKIIKCTGIPYFKDINGYPQPRNEDVAKRIECEQLCCLDYFTKPHIWSKSDKECLKEAVHKVSTVATNKQEHLDSTHHPQLFVKKEPDWLKISATDLNGKYSAAECESQWKLHLCPEVNKGKWEKYELDALYKLAKKYEQQNWDKVAHELGTNRTGYQCCIQYQMKNSLKEGKWSPEEDAYLMELVKNYKRVNHIPWTKISWFMQTRSRKQCVERYEEHLKTDLRKGYFTPNEDKIIISGVKIFKDFGKIAKFLPGRAPSQIRSRYYYLISTSMMEFTQEEDDLLLSLADESTPKNWLKISEHFHNRSKLQCRKRFQLLRRQTLKKGKCKMNTDTCGENSVEHNVFITAVENIKNKNVKDNKKKKISESEVFNEILKYHEGCSENYFGPRLRNPASEEELNDICSKLHSTMAMFSVSCNFSEKIDIINSLKEDSNFNKYDIMLLSKLAEEYRYSAVTLNDMYDLHKTLIPPNYNTLVGLNSLLVNRERIVHESCEVEGIQDEERECNRTGETLSFSAAQGLFQSRLHSLFLLPLMLSNISTTEISPEVFRKNKNPKPKKKSKRQLQMKAKMMSKIYQEKRRKLKEAQASDNGESENQLSTDVQEDVDVLEEHLSNVMVNTESPCQMVDPMDNEIPSKRPRLTKS